MKFGLQFRMGTVRVFNTETIWKRRMKNCQLECLKLVFELETVIVLVAVEKALSVQNLGNS